MNKGRPTKYKQEYADQVRDWLANGKTLYAFGVEKGVGTRTLYEWRDSNPDFLQAIKDGRELAIEWGHQFVADAVRDNTIQSVPFIMYCRNFLKLKTKDDDTPAQQIKIELKKEDMEIIDRAINPNK